MRTMISALALLILAACATQPPSCDGGTRVQLQPPPAKYLR